MAMYRARCCNQVSKMFMEGFRPLTSCKSLGSKDMVDPPSGNEPPIPQYEWKRNETIELKKARLLYQSRKRGMLENGLLLSTFAAKYLQDLSPALLDEYDNLINIPSNDWDIFYWASGVKPTPPEFDTTIMNMLKEHTLNSNRESRIKQPDLY